MDNGELEQVVEPIARKFEDDWRAGHEPRIEDYLPVLPEQAMAVYWELVAVELELRLNDGQDARVEDYVDRFPLRDYGERFVDLIATEYRLRARREPALSFTEYLERFPHQAANLIDRGIVQVQLRLVDEDSDAAESGWGESPEGQQLRRYDSISRFKLVEPHRDGGLGRVWLAQDRELDRVVALKEMRDGLDERSRARFIKEATTTAKLQHPGIVPVYGLGAHVDGRPFYAMKLVEGQTLAEATAEFHNSDPTHQNSGTREVDLRQLLRRLIDVCLTIEYAHSHRVLHRDIKPANILLGKLGETVVLDWGMTRSVDDGGGDIGTGSTIGEVNKSSSATTVGRVLGSPAYMSPEQARGDHAQVGPASDIYSLGGTLLTLLTGRAPVEGGSSDAVLEKVKAGQIHWPEAKVPRPLRSICRKAMAYKPSKRYESAAELADELERYLGGQPVEAHRESWSESLARIERRHRSFFRLALVSLIGIAVISAASALWSVRERQTAKAAAAKEAAARRDADEAVETKVQVLGYLTQIFKKSDPKQGARDVTVAECLDNAVEQAKVDFAEDPVEQAVLLHHLGQTYSGLGIVDAARECAARAVELFEQELGAAHEQTLEAKLGLGIYLGYGGAEESLEIIREVYESRREQFGTSDIRTANAAGNLGAALIIRGRLSEAVQLLESDMADWYAKPDFNQESTDGMLVTLAQAHERMGNAAESIRILEPIADRLRSEGATSLANIAIWKTLISAYITARRYADAVMVGEEILPIAKRHLSESHFLTANIGTMLGTAFAKVGRLDEAVSICEKYEALNSAHDSNPLIVVQSGNTLGSVYDTAYRFEEAARKYAEIIGPSTAALGRDHPLTLIILQRLGLSQVRSGDHELGLKALVEYSEIRRASSNAKDVDKLAAQQILLHGYLLTGRFREAKERLSKLQESAGQLLDENHPVRVSIQISEAMLRLAEGNAQRAVNVATDALDNVKDDARGAENRLKAALTLIDAYLQEGDCEQAEALAQSYLPIAATDAVRSGQLFAQLGESLLSRNLPAAEEALQSGHETLKRFPNYAGYNQSLIGTALSMRGEYGEAEKLLTEGFSRLEDHVAARAGHERFRLPTVAKRIVEHYERAGNLERADLWRGKLAELAEN